MNVDGAVSGARAFFRRHYGAGPLHLLSLLACFALAGYVVSIIHQVGHWERVLVWLVAAIVGHDAVLFPLYALADRSTGWLDARRHPERLPSVPWINHVRIPVVMSALLLGISFPLVLDLSNRPYHAATGLNVTPYENRYLAIVAVLFAGSAILYAYRVGRAAAATRRAAADARRTAAAAPVR